MVLRIDSSPLNAEFDALVQKELEKWKVPGLTIAVVHGSMTYSKAYGFAEFPDKKMTTESLFSTCSTTKAFTAAAVSLAIEDSKSTSSPIGWDTPVSSIIRDDFVLTDDHATTHTTLEDAMSHRSGLPSHIGGLLLADPEETLHEAVRKLRHFPLAYAPRTTFDYCNHMFIAVSHALEQKTGNKLGAFLRRRIWEPLGMHNTYFSIQDVKRGPESREKLVRGYTWVPGREAYASEPHMNYVPTTGTGAIVSNVLDYTKWIRALIYQSQPLSPEGHAALIKPRTIITSSDELHPLPCHHLYALGWFVENYRGELFYWHSGSWPGFGIMVGFIPSKQFGFAMMGNTVNARMAEIALYIHLIDELLGVPRNERGKCAATMEQNATETTKKCPETVEVAKRRLFSSLPQHSLPHTLPLEKYAGTYSHPGYGPITFECQDGYLNADLTDRVIETRIDLDHATGEFFVAHQYTPGGGGDGSSFYKAEFYVAFTGEVQKLGLDLEPGLKGEKIWFMRQTLH